MRQILMTPFRLWLFAVVAMTAGALTAYLVMQQTHRMAANDPQLQLADDGAAALEQGRPVTQVVPADTVDVARSLAPFVLVLDDTRKVLASSGRLDGQIPIPPAGVLAAVRIEGGEDVTWAPRPSVRLASVVRRINGARPGFIIVARSLRETEWRIARIGQMIATGWLVGLIGWTVLIALVAWLDARRP
jgi:hypothetical protein